MNSLRLVVVTWSFHRLFFLLEVLLHYHETHQRLGHNPPEFGGFDYVLSIGYVLSEIMYVFSELFSPWPCADLLTVPSTAKINYFLFSQAFSCHWKLIFSDPAFTPLLWNVYVDKFIFLRFLFCYMNNLNNLY